MTLDEQIEILQAAKRLEPIERKYVYHGEWVPFSYSEHTQFDFAHWDFRIADPYAELKAAAKDLHKQIRHKEWGTVDWRNAGYPWAFDDPPECYEIRDKPKAKKVVKYLCWDNGLGRLDWLEESANIINPDFKRRPQLDYQCEVENE